ncbi:MAG: protein kinase [Planctomycetaceae bacterium]
MTENLPNSDLGDLAEKTLGDFKLLRRLGRGGMAEVYLAEQKSLGRFVAIKILLPEMLKESDDVPLKRFEQEARTAGAISHPNIVQVYLIGEQDGLHYIVQEFVEGVNLSEFIKRHGPPNAATGLKILEHVAAALKVSGDAGIVHRDIKPENIMLTGRMSEADGVDVAKVTDFGLAQLAQAPEALNLTQRGTTMGTPLYMSPEQINGEKLDPRSDIYSLGVTCYHMLAGRAPFRGETAMAVAAQHLQDTPDPLQQRRPDLPKSVCDLIERMMQKAPDGRFQDATALLEAIKKAKTAINDGQTDMSLSALGIPSMATHSKARKSKRTEVAIMLASCLGVAGISAALGHYMRPIDPLRVPAAAIENRLPTRDAQFAFAVANPESKAAWRAVIDNYGDEPLEGGWARVHLGRIYLNEERYTNARELFAEVQQNEEESLQVQGTIGLAAVLLRTDQLDEAAKLIESVDEDGTLGTAMRGWYNEVTRQLRNRDQ